jgi:hypothetical protein
MQELPMDAHDSTWPTWLVTLLSLLACVWMAYAGAAADGLRMPGSV